MSRRLDKAESRKRWSELRDLWNEFDPIGVMDDPTWPRDEYDSYCGPSMRLLEQNASDEEFIAYIHSALDHMGMNTKDNAPIISFIKKMRDWFQKNWSGTSA